MGYESPEIQQTMRIRFDSDVQILSKCIYIFNFLFPQCYEKAQK